MTSLLMEPLRKRNARAPGGAVVLAIAFAGLLSGQTVTATASQRANLCRHVLLQMAGMGRPAEETARRQAAFISMSGLTPPDAKILLSASAALASAMAPINQQAAAIVALGPSAAATDTQNLAVLDQNAQQLLTSAAAGLLADLSVNGVQRLSAVAAKQPQP